MAQRKPQQTISLDEYRKRYQNPAPPQPKKAKRQALVKTTMTRDEYHALALEKDFMVDLQEQLTNFGFLWYHQAPGDDSKRNQGHSGFPDIVAVHPVSHISPPRTAGWPPWACVGPRATIGRPTTGLTSWRSSRGSASPTCG